MRLQGVVICLGLNAALALAVPPPRAAAQAGPTQVRPFAGSGVAIAPQVAALGGRHVSTPGPDPALALYNPAALTDTATGVLSVAGGRLPAGVALAQAAYARRLRLGGRTRAHWHAGLHTVGYGPLTRRDAAGTPLGDFAASELTLYGGLARAFGPRLRAGTTLRLAQARIDDAAGWALALDFGLLYTSPSGRWQAGAALRGLGGALGQGLQPAGAPRPGPAWALDLGASYRPPGAPLRLSLTTTWGPAAQAYYYEETLGQALWRSLTVGLEVLPARVLALRLGYSARRRAELAVGAEGLTLAGLSAGFGLRAGRFALNYAYVGYGAVGGASQVAVQARLGRGK